jgi:hypothetical protein
MADTLLAPFEDGDDISFHICIEEGFILSASVCDSDISSWCTDDEEDGSDVSSLSVDDEVCWLDEADDENDVVMHEERRIDITVDTCETDDNDNVNNDFNFKVRRCVDLSFTTTTTATMSTKYDELDSTTITTLEDIPCDCCAFSLCYCYGYCSATPTLSTSCSVSTSPLDAHLISGFEVYLAFYVMALVTFLTIKFLPAKVLQIALRHNTSWKSQNHYAANQESSNSFQPRENIKLEICL